MLKLLQLDRVLQMVKLTVLQLLPASIAIAIAIAMAGAVVAAQ